MDGMIGDARQYVAQVTGSNPFSFAVPIKLYTAAALSPSDCSDVSTYPSWTLNDVPTTGSILICSHSRRFRPFRPVAYCRSARAL